MQRGHVYGWAERTDEAALAIAGVAMLGDEMLEVLG
jgi:hypothetical protein